MLTSCFKRDLWQATVSIFVISIYQNTSYVLKLMGSIILLTNRRDEIAIRTGISLKEALVC